MKKYLSVLILAVFIIPSIALASWWNPISWFSNDDQVGERKQQLPTTTPESQIQNTNTETTKEQQQLTPVANTQSEIKTIEELQTEVATLKANLDNLYKAHNDLVQDFKGLIGITTAFRNEIQNIKNTKTNNTLSPDISSRVSELEKKLNTVCDNAFSNLFGGCPSSSLLSESLESRIEKLERTY